VETCHLGRPHGCPWPWTWRPCAQCQTSITLMSRVLANSDRSEPMTRGAMCMCSTSWPRRCLEPLDRGHNSLSGRGATCSDSFAIAQTHVLSLFSLHAPKVVCSVLQRPAPVWGSTSSAAHEQDDRHAWLRRSGPLESNSVRGVKRYEAPPCTICDSDVVEKVAHFAARTCFSSANVTHTVHKSDGVWLVS
jgi:hypothetical protein